MSDGTVSPKKQQALHARMDLLGILESDLDECFVHGQGAGGQKINKTASCVYLKHIPSGLEVKCQQERSRALNRFLARRLLCDKLDAIRNGKQSLAAKVIEKIRKQKRRRIRRAQEKNPEANIAQIEE